MLGNWQDWCRFCTNTNAEKVYKMDSMDELENVNKYFRLSLTLLDGIQLSVCQECCGFLTKLDGFRDRCLKADQMFKELIGQEILTEMYLKSIRVKHGLDSEESYLPSLLEPTFVSCSDSHGIEIGEIVVVKTESPDVVEELPPHPRVSNSSPVPAKKLKVSEAGSSTPAISSLQTYIAKELREYFRTQRTVVVNGSSLLKKTTLSDTDRKKAMQIVANHLLMCRPEPKKYDLVAYAKASIELFPMLKIDSELGYDAVYSPARRCGFLGNVVKNIRERKRAEMKVFDNSDKDDKELDDTETDPFEDKEMDMERLKEELKVTPAFQHNTNKIIDGMAKTYEHRRKLVMSSSKLNILLEYPRFVDTYGLIQNDFEKCYPEQHLNLKALFKKEFQETVLHMGNQKVISLETKDWGLPELAALCWVSLTPPTSNRRVRCPSLQEAFDCLLKHQLETEEPQFKSSPTIIAQGDAKNNIKKYFVALNGQSIPTNDTFVDALDIFFKVHFVFDLEFDIALRNFLIYIEYYVFGIRNKHCTNTTVNKCRMMLRTSENADV